MGGIEEADDGGFQGDARRFGHQGRRFGGGHGRPGGMRRRCAHGVEAAAHRLSPRPLPPFENVEPGRLSHSREEPGEEGREMSPHQVTKTQRRRGGAAVPQDGTTSPRVSVAPFSGTGRAGVGAVGRP
jgi:hypothetical protein